MRLIPLDGRILVEEDAFKYQGLIEIPDKAKRRPTTGVVRAVGEHKTEVQVSALENGDPVNTIITKMLPFTEKVKVGDHILYAQFSGTGITLKNQPAYRVLSEEEVLLILEGEVEIEEISA